MVLAETLNALTLLVCVTTLRPLELTRGWNMGTPMVLPMVTTPLSAREVIRLSDLFAMTVSVFLTRVTCLVIEHTTW